MGANKRWVSMTREKWLDLKDKIEEQFGIEEYNKSALEDVPDSVVETLIFNGPLGKIKLEWISKPRTLGEKTIYSRRIGSDVKVEKIYSQDERSEFLKAYKLEDGEWLEISAGEFNF